MSRTAARYQISPAQDEGAIRRDAFLPLQLSSVAEATSGLIRQGLAVRMAKGRATFDPLTDESGALRREIAPLALAYEAALLSGLSPQEVRTLRRLLSRVEAAALKLSGRT